jgi:hypothetical protein
MSRTKKTDPYWVLLNDPKGHGLSVSEVHDHSKGDCDLPANARDQVTCGGWKHTRCFYIEDSDGRSHFCGCDLCTAQSWRKINNKAERRRSNGLRRNFVSDPNYYDDMDDVYEKDTFW